VTDALPPIGFWSYATSDDLASRGRLSQLRVLLAHDLQLKIGRTPEVKIFQDIKMIPLGANWEADIHKALTEASFLIPIITPGYLQSEWCCKELLYFHAKERALGRNNLIFPVNYVTFDSHVPPDTRALEALAILNTRQIADFRALRTRNPESEEVADWLDRFTDSICCTLQGRQAIVTDPVRHRSFGRTHRPGWLLPAALGAVTALSLAIVVGGQPTTSPTSRADSPNARVPTASPGAVLRDCPTCPQMVLVPSGKFLLGVSDEEEDRENFPKDMRRQALPLTTITIGNAFWMGRYPVTRGEYAAFAKAKPDLAGDRWNHTGFSQTDLHPVVNVTAIQAASYAQWLSELTGQRYRLPTEAEWEYAARATTGSARFWGDGFGPAPRYAVARSDFTVGTAPVASDRQPNRFGLYDMLGNVWQWVADCWHPDYIGQPSNGSAWTGGSCEDRIARGGSWLSNSSFVRSGVRYHAPVGFQGLIGFRLVRDAP
jgi:formylglycine-generating enzyme required for sulfatase activity